MIAESGSIIDLSVKFKAKLKDGSLVDAKVDGVPSWTLSNAEIGTLDVKGDGMAAVLLCGAAVGLGQVLVKADADLGEGVTEIVGLLDVELKAPQASVVEIEAVVRP